MRLFVAILFGEDFKNALAAYQSDLMAWGKASWSRRENFHLTLAFIGERDSADDVIAALDRVEHKSFEAELAGRVRFGAIRCAGIADGGESRLLAEKVRRALDRAGIPYDRRPMKPHITLARQFRPTSSTPETEEMLRRLKPAPARETVRAFSLMRSERRNGQLVYTPLWTKPLA